MKFLTIITLIFSLFLIVSCGNNRIIASEIPKAIVSNSSTNEKDETRIDEITGLIDNDENYNQLITREINSNDFVRFVTESSNILTVEEYNTKFQIECLRKPNDNSLYSINKTDSGGVLYTFFGGSHEDNNLYCWYYVLKSLEYNDFQSIVSETSTIDDVKQIDPATIIYESMIHEQETNDDYQMYSAHYLKDGILRINYALKDGAYIIVGMDYSKGFFATEIGFSDGSNFPVRILDKDFID